MADIVTFTENTLFKVKDALKEVGLPDQQVIDAISAMQNRGVLFCERPSEDDVNAIITARLPGQDELIHSRELAHGLRPRKIS